MDPTLGSDPGLSSDEAAARLAADGPNEIPPPRPPSALARLAGQLVHFFALLLWGAAGLAFVAGLPQLGVAIIVVVLLNAVFAFVQESRATQAAARLRALLPQRVTVRRDGRPVELDAADVVEGDVLVLGSGDRVPADATVLIAHDLLIDTSTMTGESVPDSTVAGGTIAAGTFVVEGEAEARVDATGPRTRLADIARLTTGTARPDSPLTIEIHRVVRAVAAIAVGVGGVFFLISLALGTPASDGFVFAVGVTVALVPEGLLPTVTLSLAWGAEQMARRQVLVRRLDAVETLGSTTFICTDKTGTLTRNQMTVVEVWTPAGSASIDGVGYEPAATLAFSSPTAEPAVARLAEAARRCSTGRAVAVDGPDGTAQWIARGDPMEAAIDALARRAGVVAGEAEVAERGMGGAGAGERGASTGDDSGERGAGWPERRFPFDPRRRRMSVLSEGRVWVKGAPDAVLPLCTDAGALDEPAVTASVGVGGATGVAGALAELAARGLRVLAVAGREAPGVAPESAEAAERDLSLYGLLAFEDPPRTDVADAIERCRAAGVAVAMITGDHPTTARAIADEVGLRPPDGRVLTGAELPDDDAVLAALVDHDGVVIARVTPEDKLRIARALRSRGHVVAMTGDGVNDGPALHEADIGVAMGRSGTDVAREAADLVLLDDNFATIVGAIEQGRAAFLNIRRFLTYHLTDNVAELTPFLVWALSGGRFPLALGVLQILALDIGTDTLSAVALGAEPPSARLLSGPPVAGRLLDRSVARRAFGVLGPIEGGFAMTAFLVSMWASGWRPGDAFPTGAALATASGAAFLAVVVAQSANAMACRSSTRTPGELGWTTNRLLLPAIAVEAAFSLVVVFATPIARELDHRPPSWWGWAVAALAGPTLLAVDAADKARRRRRRGRRPA